jgi:hypothetical protein
MAAVVFSPVDNLKVLDAVVMTVAVFVMDVFGW